MVMMMTITIIIVIIIIIISISIIEPVSKAHQIPSIKNFVG